MTISRMALLSLPGIVLAFAKPAAPAPRNYGVPVFLAELQSKSVRESSGLAASRRTPGVLWTHNDSGGGPILYATDRRGRDLARIRVTGATATDWEDMAAGPGTGENATLYIGDIGGNNGRRSGVVYRVFEPPVDREKTGQTGDTLLAERFPFAYPDGAHDAETLLVHPVTGEVCIVAKTDSGVSGVFQFPQPLTRDRTATLRRTGAVRFENPLAFRGRAVGRLATGGAVSPDGTRVVIRTYTEAYEWTIRPGQSIADALTGKPRAVVVPFFGQFESICYRADSRALLTTAEGHPCPLWEIAEKPAGKPKARPGGR